MTHRIPSAVNAWRLHAGKHGDKAAEKQKSWHWNLNGMARGVMVVGILSCTISLSMAADLAPADDAQSAATAAVDTPQSIANVSPLPMSSAERARALDAKYGYKGWNIMFPSYGDSLLNDDGGWRTALASHGFGFSDQGTLIFQSNMLNTPGQIPSGYGTCGKSSLGYGCSGGRSYFGQRPSIMMGNSPYLTYDMSQYGVPDGQIAMGANVTSSTDQQYSASTFRFNSLSWYQTMFDKRLEVKAGYFANLPEFAGTFIGGMVVNPFGPAASVPIVLGMSPNSISTPNVRFKWNITDNFYAQTSVQRSLPVRGASGNPIYDEVQDNPSGMAFNSGVVGTRELYTTELGYRRASAPNTPFTWWRAGYMYNNSTFTDYSKLTTNPNATKQGADGLYILGDYQIKQFAPGSGHTAYQGMYIGGTFMYGDPKAAAFTQYYEARAYFIAPFANRPQDMLSFVYSHNKTSKYLLNALNGAAPFTNFYPASETNSLTAAYTYHVRPGLYATGGLGYTDHPSLTSFTGEGSSLNVLLSLYWVF